MGLSLAEATSGHARVAWLCLASLRGGCFLKRLELWGVMLKRLGSLLLMSSVPVCVCAQVAVRAVPERAQWYLRAGESTYVVGVDERGSWRRCTGAGVPDDAQLPKAHSAPERASFDPPVNTTPLEYPAWGAGLLRSRR